MIGRSFRKAVVIILSAVLVSLLCPVSVMATGESRKNADPVSFYEEHSGVLDESETYHWFKFTMPEAGRITLNIESDRLIECSLFYGPDIETELFYNTSVYSSDNNIFVLSHVFDLTGGTYYFVVMEPAIETINYKFSIDYWDCGESVVETYINNNNSFDKASKTYLNAEYNGYLANNDNADYYKFTLSKDTKVTINTYSYVGSVKYYLYNSSKTCLKKENSATLDISANTITEDLAKGTYYFVVKGSGNYFGNYHFTISCDNLPALSITQQPVDHEGQIGELVNFTVTAKGKGLKYQWQTKKNSEWVNSTQTGADTNTFTLKLTEPLDYTQIRCAVTDSYDQLVISDAVMLCLDPVYIISQPKNYSGDVGNTATFKVKAKGKDVGIKYQWQTYRSGKWVNSSLQGSKSATLSVPVTEARNGYKFRCVLTASDNNFSIISSEVTLNVKMPVSITTEPKDYTGVVGSTAKFKVVAEGTGLKYQWQTYKNGKWVNSSLTGSSTATLSVPVTQARDGYKFRCVVTDASGKTATSKAVVLHVSVSVNLAITTQPKNYTGPVGSTAKFTVKATGTGLKYQWQTYKNGKWVNSSLNGSSTATLSVPVTQARDGYRFRCVITDAGGKTVTSNAVLLKINS